MKCKICNQPLNQNHLRIHGVSTETYCKDYLGYDHTCKDCGVETVFYNSKIGFSDRCMVCANREIGRKKEELYKTYRVQNTCKNCNKKFNTDSRYPVDYCSDYICRKYHPSDPKNINDIIHTDFKKCPYCKFKIKGWASLDSHLSKHFTPPEIEIVKRKVDVEIFKLPIQKCKNPTCNNIAELHKTEYKYKNFCAECNCMGMSARRLLYTDEELKQSLILQGSAVSRAYNIKKSTPEGLADIKRINRETGKKNSIFLKKYFKTKKGKGQIRAASLKQSHTMKQKIAKGEFTPNITNSWTHWDAIIKLNGTTRKFRSSWEACFYVCNPNMEYEKLRIPYKTEDKIDRTYIADFYDIKNKILYEIKPKNVYLIQQHKMDAIIKYCLSSGIKFIWVNERNILNYVDKSRFNSYNIKQYEKMIRGIGYE